MEYDLLKDSFELVIKLAASGVAVGYAVEVLKSNLFPIPVTKFPRLSAFVASLVAAGVVWWSQVDNPVGIFTQPIQNIIATIFVIFITSWVVYKTVIKQKGYGSEAPNVTVVNQAPVDTQIVPTPVYAAQDGYIPEAPAGGQVVPESPYHDEESVKSLVGEEAQVKESPAVEDDPVVSDKPTFVTTNPVNTFTKK